ncbi:HNH endonuclease [Wohlfahrtiimonas chitiniclastica]|uniref:HNH endonuclease n=1 Tax=Wohlfahrtiimonas chitiniclastica TaxID=400946 RepID=UPI00036D82A5|nr:HNH endonuclease domain-containing protein [Wohlfahrtiimonas chitiniclastica]
MLPKAEEQLDFLQKIHLILETGNTTSTYKFALLLAITNLAIIQGEDNNNTLTLSYNDIAEQFIIQYWKQSLPFEYVEKKGFVLQQNTGKQIVIIQDIQKLICKYPTLSKAMKSIEWNNLIQKAARTIKTYPARFLQNIEGQSFNFLYTWQATGTHLQLNKNIMYCLRQFNYIIRQLVQKKWADFVCKLPKNKEILKDQHDIQMFLFDEQRTSLKKVSDIYMELQNNCCFYCQQKINGIAEVDHFIPWSYYQQDTLHNFVIADKKCNGAKSNFLADPQLLRKWLERNKKYGDTIHSASEDIGIISNLETTINIAQWAYQRAINNEALVWTPPKELVQLNIDNGRDTIQEYFQ